MYACILVWSQKKTGELGNFSKESTYPPPDSESLRMTTVYSLFKRRLAKPGRKDAKAIYTREFPVKEGEKKKGSSR